MLFGSWGLSGLFHLFHQALVLEIHTCFANEDINQINSFFEQMTSAGLDLPDSFCAMFLLTHLPNDFFSFCSTVSQTIASNDFTVLDSHCNPTFLMWRMNLWVVILLIKPMWYKRVLLIITSGDVLMDRQTLCCNPLWHLAVFTLDPNRGDHSSLLIRRLRTINAKGSRFNSRRRTKEKERPLKLTLLREKVLYMKSSWMKLC